MNIFSKESGYMPFEDCSRFILASKNEMDDFDNFYIRGLRDSGSSESFEDVVEELREQGYKLFYLTENKWIVDDFYAKGMMNSKTK